MELQYFTKAVKDDGKSVEYVARSGGARLTVTRGAILPRGNWHNVDGNEVRETPALMKAAVADFNALQRGDEPKPVPASAPMPKAADADKK
jgi:hypothetical protein